MNFLSNIFDKLRANNSYDAETNEECENYPDVALNAQKIVLFASVDAASEISWTLRGCWDGCNGVAFTTRDYVFIDTAKLLETEFCKAGDYCHCTHKDFCVNKEKRNIEAQYMTKPVGYFASAVDGTQDNAILAEIEHCCGSYLEKLTPAQKAAWALALIAEAQEPEGIEIDYLIPSALPGFEQLFDLSNACKLDLATAVLNYLRDSYTTGVQVA